MNFVFHILFFEKKKVQIGRNERKELTFDLLLLFINKIILARLLNFIFTRFEQNGYLPACFENEMIYNVQLSAAKQTLIDWIGEKKWSKNGNNQKPNGHDSAQLLLVNRFAYSNSLRTIFIFLISFITFGFRIVVLPLPQTLFSSHFSM